MEKAWRSGRARRMAATAASVPASGRAATSRRSASSIPAEGNARRKPGSVTPAIHSPADSNGNSTMPETRNSAGRSVDVSRTTDPGSTRSSRANARFTTIERSSASSPRSVPRSSFHSPRRRRSVPTTARPVVLSSPSPSAESTVAVPKRTGTTSASSGRARSAATAAAAPVTVGPSPGRASVAVARTSKPVLSSRSRKDTISPRERRSMSNSSAPTTAIPVRPSTARAGWRERLRQAKARGLTGGRGPGRVGAAASRTPPAPRARPGEGQRRRRWRRWRA